MNQTAVTALNVALAVVNVLIVCVTILIVVLPRHRRGQHTVGDDDDSQTPENVVGTQRAHRAEPLRFWF